MKTILLIILCLISCSVIAQEYEYCTIKQVNNKSITLLKTDGQPELLKDSEGKEINDLFQAYLIMEQDKWEFVISYSKHVNPDLSNVGVYRAEGYPPDLENTFIFKRKKSSGKA